ncbi:MAG: cytochrome c biogenesis protein CcdA [Catalinimonas sp.]
MHASFIRTCLAALLLVHAAAAQTVAPPTWSFDVSRQEVKAGEEVELIFKAQVPESWYLYSSDFDPELGPYLTTFDFTQNDTYELLGEIEPVDPQKKYDEIWGGEYTYFKKRAEFRQRVRLLKGGVRIPVTIDYQICSDVSGQCVLFEKDHTFEGFRVVTTGAVAPMQTDEGRADASASPRSRGATEAAGGGQAVVVDESAGNPASEVINPARPVSSVPTIAPGVEGNARRGGLPAFMLLAFGSGLVALLTPCVFPMIPMTVTFFTRSSKSRAKSIRLALIYGLSIVLIYTIPGTLISALMGAEFANFLSTHWIPNVFFFFVFIFFALSFLGMFEIVLPSGLVNQMDARADKGGLVGVFFMAFTLVLVSFSCTGPIVGSLLVASAQGDLLWPALGFFAFSMAFALPFTLFAFFPQWLSNLPKSGGWLNSVKVVLGFLELALAFKFLSIADQAYHWNLLDREVYLAIWIAVFTGLALYLLGKLRLPHDSPVERLPVPRLVLGLITLTFVVYLLPGMFGAPLKPLAGYLPPQSTLDFDLTAPGSGVGGVPAEQRPNGCPPPKYADFLHLPHGLQGYFDLDEALACARAQEKPVFVDFTGHGCVNCREMEARVWSDPRVLQRLRNDFVVVALYVDDKTELPESDWYTSEYDDKVKKTIGKQNADWQISRFQNNAQPYYLLLNPATGQPLVAPKAYDLDVNHFVDFLESGKEAYRNRLALQ